MATATVLQLSDTHFTESPSGTVSGQDPAARLQRVLEAWAHRGLRADLVVLTGDNADDGTLGACQRLAEALRGLGAPVLAVSGNHDQPAPVQAVFGTAQHADVGEWRVVGLASQRPDQIWGTLSVPDALASLDCYDSRPTLLAIHHPPVGTSTHRWFQLEGAEELLAALADRPHVRAVVSGHLHEAFEFTGAGGLALLGAPSTLYALHHDGETWEHTDAAPTGGRVLHLSDDGTLTSSLLVA